MYTLGVILAREHCAQTNNYEHSDDNLPGGGVSGRLVRGADPERLVQLGEDSVVSVLDSWR